MRVAEGNSLVKSLVECGLPVHSTKLHPCLKEDMCCMLHVTAIGAHVLKQL